MRTLFIVIRFFSEGIQYSTYDAVTYFDSEGRYQPVNSVAEDYALYDAKKKKCISSFILYQDI